jgi:hypothetical protein
MFDERKPGEQRLAPELVALERQLLGLTPALLRIDRDRLMFEAGRASALAASDPLSAPNEPSPNPSLQGRGIGTAATLRVAAQRNWFWPAATALMTAASLLLATMLLFQNRSQYVAQHSTVPAGPPESRDIAQVSNNLPAEQFARHYRYMKPVLNDGYLGIRYIAVTAGVGALPDNFQSAATVREVPDKNKPSEPATVRNLMNELLPAAAPSNPSRS